MTQRWFATTSLIALLTACGGGSGGDNPAQSNVPPPTLTPAADVSINAPERFASGDGIALWAQVDGSSNRRFNWQQLSGPAVNIANPQSALAAFAIAESGSYRFAVSIDGQQAEISFDTSSDDDQISSFSDQTVVSGGRVSLRAEALDAVAEVFPDNLRWQQLSGPSISDVGNQTPQLYTFTAPQVSQDTELRFRLTGNVDGSAGEDIISVWVTADPAPITDAFFDQPLARVSPYRADSPWAAGLMNCVYNTQFSQPCAVTQLPLIGQRSSDPSIDEILDRLLVSHPWMGQQFETLLRNYDPFGDFRRLLASVTAVVISADVRPSFYWVVTGAIYLDPETLWQYPWQQRTINEDPDFRSGFGNQLQFLIPWRYVQGNSYASLYYPPGVKLERPWSQIEPEIASLLYHELAHANDFFPRSSHSSISADTLLDEYFARVNDAGLPSDQLTASYGLNSSTMAGLAQVSFRGQTASDTQKALTASQVANAFFNDRASDYYAYSTVREDLAMLFEEIMMQRRYGIYRDVAVTTPRSDNDSEDLIVAQGQRGRVGDATIKPRVQLVLNQLLPEVANLSNQLPAPQPMATGVDWFEAINLPTSTAPLLAPQPRLQQRSPLQGRDHFGPRHQHRQQ
ncbi:hypothetical protein [Ferrimonas senticii]|uniref:hypothetical protein n=1 Tax=Ferrimonas senticii TaxID=394566 RepID=UPI0004161731|nr:hypothetical protein [Ferrimonas senticii]